MKSLLYLIVAFCAGGLVPIQGSLNAHLSKGLNHPLQATFISFFGAVILIGIILLALNPPLPNVTQFKSIPAIYYTGGIYGALFVTTIFVLTPRIGIANTVVAAIIGQLVLSVILDHFGFFNLERRPINAYRMIGCIGLLISLYLIQKTN